MPRFELELLVIYKTHRQTLTRFKALTSRFAERRLYFDSYVMARFFFYFLSVIGSELPTSLPLSGNELEHHATAAD